MVLGGTLRKWAYDNHRQETPLEMSILERDVSACYLFTYLRLSVHIHWTETDSGLVDIYG